MWPLFKRRAKTTKNELIGCLMGTKIPFGKDAVFFINLKVFTYYQPGINLLFGIFENVAPRNLRRLLIMFFLYNNV